MHPQGHSGQNTDSMRDIISEALRGHRANYIDVRIEERHSSHVSFRGRDLEDIGETTDYGGNVRALVNGGWGFASFNDVGSLRRQIAMAIDHARLVGDGPSEIAEPPSTVDIVPVNPGIDPASVLLAEKTSLVQEYNETMYASSPKIHTTRTVYQDARVTSHFANSSGAYIEQHKMDIRLVAIAIAREGDVVQQGVFSTGTSQGFQELKGLHDKVGETARRAERLLSARPIKGGEYALVLDPELAGVFVHEAFGHLSEADHVYENPRLRDLLVIGRTFGRPILSIFDGAAIPGLRGSFKYDDEGVRAQKTYLIRGGLLVGRLHSLETAKKLGESPTGNARAINYRYPPIVRMTNTAIEPGETAFDDMIGEIKEGVYAKGSLGGETMMEMFTFSPEEAYMIRNGRLAEPVRGALISGNVFTTLQNIDAIGKDLEWGQGGGCGKGEQAPLPVADGSPHIRISRAVVGGR